LEIPVLVPDVNASQSDFACEERADAAEPGTAERGSHGRWSIRFGLSAVRNVGEGVAEALITEREKNGQFRDFHDFCARVEPSVLNKRTVESLINGGAFDSLGHPRKGLLTVFETITDAALQKKRDDEAGKMTLWGEVEVSTSGESVFDDRL